MIEESDIHAVHGGTRETRQSKRMTKKRDEFYKLMAKRDELLTKLCRVHERIKAAQKSIARISRGQQG